MAKLLKLAAVNLDSRDIRALSRFYRDLLELEEVFESEDFIALKDPDSGVEFFFQNEPLYEPPVWPNEVGRPGKSMHLDLQVADLAKAEERARSLGAVKAPAQFLEADGCVVYFDPSGHPFCLFQ